ncbi:MAG TPA: DoxX family protein [Chitinophagales bacterium]
MMQLFFLYLMAVVYIIAGLNHFINPKAYMKFMPTYLPWHYELVLISGVLEVLFGALLFFPATRVIGAWSIILLLIAIFPANVQMAVNFYQKKSPYLWIAIARLPLQLILIWWAWQYTKEIF